MRVLVNVALRSSDPAVESHRLENFDLPSSEGESVLPLIYASREWTFTGTRFERNEAGEEVRWLLFVDSGPASA